MSFCGQCGSSVTGARFCTTCGAPTGEPPTPTAGPPTKPPAPPMDWPVAAPSQPAEWAGSAPVTEQPPLPAESAPAPPDRRSSRRVWWLVGGVVAIAAIGVGVGVYAIKQMTTVSGAETPEAAVVDLVQAVDDKDFIRAATLLPPDELEQLSGALTSAGGALTRTGVVDAGSGGGDFPSILSGLNVNIRGLKVQSELVAPDLAQVTIVGGTVEASVDPSATTGVLHSALEKSDIASTGGSFSLDVAQVNATLDRPIMVAAVQRDGRWYVSPTYTAGEYLLRGTGATRAHVGAGDGQQAVYATPEAAARGLLDQVGKAVNSHESADLAEGLAPAEAAAVLTYRRALDERFHNSIGVEALDWDATFEVVENNGDTAVVRPTLITIDGYDGRNRGTIEVQDGCVLLNGDNRGCLTDSSYTWELNDLLHGTDLDVDLDLVVVRAGDGWRVSAGATAVHALTKALDSISPSQARYFIVGWLPKSTDRIRVLGSIPIDRQVALDQRADLDFADSEVYKVVEVVVEPGQSVRFDGGSTPSNACVVEGIYSADGERLSEIEEPGTYRLVAFSVVQNDDGYYRYVHASSCAIDVESR